MRKLVIAASVTAALALFGVVMAIGRHEVGSASMEPTLSVGDSVFVNRLAYLVGRQPARGDVVVLAPPTAGGPSVLYIKRVIGLPGETLTLVVEPPGDSIRVLIDEASLPENVLVGTDPELNEEEGAEWTVLVRGQAIPARYWQAGATPVTLGPDEFFLLGDNRNESMDSRHWGAIKREDIKGRLWMP